MSPGTYCGGLSVSSINNVYFTPGIYYVANGDLYITSVNNVTCPTCTTNNGVAFVLTQTTGNNSDIGGVRISSDNNISLNASAANQTSPPLYAGVLFYQDRRVPNGTMSSTSKIFTISSLNTVTLTGAIYFPNNRIDISSINNSGIDHQRLHRLDRPLHQVLVVQQQLRQRLRGDRRHAAGHHHDHDDDLDHDHQQGQGPRVGRPCASAIDVRAGRLWRPTARAT